jgi:MFS family permease
MSALISTDKMPFSVYLLAICQALLMSGSSLLITASALVSLTLTDDKILVTLPLSLQFLAQMLTSIPASLLMGKWGRRAGFMFGSLFGITGGCLAVYAVFTTNFWLFAVASFSIGVFNGFGTYFRFAAVDVVAVSNRAKAISYVMVGGVIAAFIGPNLANFGRGMVDNIPFVGGFVYVTVLYVLIFIVLFFIKLPPASIVDLQHTGRPLKQIAMQPTFIVAVICGMLGYGVMTYVMTATPLAMHHHQHAFDQTAFVIQWHVLAMFAPSFFTGTIIQKVGVIKVMVTGAVLALICTLINLSGTSVWHFWVALVALGISWNFLFIGASTLLTETYKPEETAKSQALNDFMVFSMVTIASLSAGIFQNKFGWESVNIGGILFVGVILASIFWLVRMPVEKRLAAKV